MNLATRFRYGLARLLLFGMEGKAGGLPIVSSWVRAHLLSPSFSWLTAEGYRKNAVVFACISALAFDYPEAPLRVYPDDTDDAEAIPDHPLRALLARPNPIMGERELSMYTVVYAAIGGNAYWHIVRDSRGRPVECWPYHAEQIHVIPGGDSWVKGYTFRHPEGHEEPIDPNDIVHFKWPSPDPLAPWQAQPPLAAAASEVDSDNEMGRYLRTLLANDAIPRTLVRQSPERMMTDDEVRRAKAQFASNYGGDGRGGVLIVEAGASVERLSLDLQQLSFEALHRVPEKRIAAVLRVPLSVAGVGDDPTYANSEEAYKRYTLSTRVPLWRLWGSEVQNSLGDAFGIVVRHDTSSVAALQEDTSERWTRANAAFQAGRMTLNQANRYCGLPAVDGGDIYLWSASIFPVPAAQIAAVAAAEVTATIAPPTPPPALPAPEPEEPDEDAIIEQRSRDGVARKATALASARRVARALQRIRRQLTPSCTRAFERYFADLADRVVARARDSGKADGLPTVEQLLLSIDGETLFDLMERWYVQIAAASWETWNVALGVELAFEATDPAVVAALETAAQHVTAITSTTRDAIRAALQHAADQGWSLAQFVDGADGMPGLRTIVQETYRGRAMTIARTELAIAQQTAAHGRYVAAGVSQVVILDNGQDDPDEECAQLNGSIQTLDWFRDNPIAHPNCTRAAAPYVP